MRSTAERPSDRPAECSAREVVDALVLDERAVVDQPDRRRRRARVSIARQLGHRAGARRTGDARSRRRSAPTHRAPRSGRPPATARKRSPCSAADAAISSHGSGTPACATSCAAFEHRAGDDRVGVAGAAQVQADGSTCASSASRRCSVWRSATLLRVRQRVFAVAAQIFARHRAGELHARLALLIREIAQRADRRDRDAADHAAARSRR